MAPPVPIPNTEVKRCCADDSMAKGYAKVGRRQYPRPVQVKARTGRPFFKWERGYSVGGLSILNRFLSCSVVECGKEAAFCGVVVVIK